MAEPKWLKDMNPDEYLKEDFEAKGKSKYTVEGIDKNDPEWSTQYKIDCKAKIETAGQLFEEVKHYEETEVLPEGFYVNGIIIASIIECKEYIG